MRYKGQVTPRQVDRDYPHQVEIAIPSGGLGTLLNAMRDFCRGADFKTRGIGLKRLETGRDGVRFCFKAPEEAAAEHHAVSRPCAIRCHATASAKMRPPS